MNENENIIDDFFGNIEDQEEKEISLAKQNNERLLIMQDQVKKDLMNFTRSLIKKAQAKNDLKDKVTKILMDRLDDEEEVQNMGTSTLLRALEILNKGDNDFVGSILNSLKSSTSLNLNLDLTGENKNTPAPRQEKELKEINKEDFQAVRNVLNFLNKAKESGEFPELNND